MGKERRYKSISTYWNYSNSHWQLSCHVIWGMNHVVCYTELWQWYRDNKTFLKQFQLYFYSFYIYFIHNCQSEYAIITQQQQSSKKSWKNSDTFKWYSKNWFILRKLQVFLRKNIKSKSITDTQRNDFPNVFNEYQAEVT